MTTSSPAALASTKWRATTSYNQQSRNSCTQKPATLLPQLEILKKLVCIPIRFLSLLHLKRTHKKSERSTSPSTNLAFYTESGFEITKLAQKPIPTPTSDQMAKGLLYNKPIIIMVNMHSLLLSLCDISPKLMWLWVIIGLISTLLVAGNKRVRVMPCTCQSQAEIPAGQSGTWAQANLLLIIGPNLEQGLQCLRRIQNGRALRDAPLAIRGRDKGLATAPTGGGEVRELAFVK